MALSVDRRTFLGGTAAAGLGFAFTGAGSLEAFARPDPNPPAPFTGYGNLVNDPNRLLALPKGFSYKVVARSGVTQTRDGLYPSDPDGMGVFRRPGRNGGSILVCNHEIGGAESRHVPKTVPGLVYDENAYGGTTTIVVDRNGKRLDAYTSMAGTDNNCAGGITPWKTWLTCEEVERKAGTLVTRLIEGERVDVPLLKDHGYVFEVDPRSQEANIGQAPIPLKFLGRYSHEAVAVDPDRHVIYLTEDARDPFGLYYRWSPPRGFRGAEGTLAELASGRGGSTAGRLQAMSCYSGEQHVADLSLATEVGTTYRVRWVDVPDRDATSESIRNQFSAEDPVTHAQKLEGQWWGRGGVYFVSSFARRTDGSPQDHDGQVWFYDPWERTVALKTIFGLNPNPAVPGDPVNFDGPDNITVSPHGGLILAEDGSGRQHLIGVSRGGTAYPMARNQRNNSEFAGPAFSADGRILFLNIYAGWTFAVTGPWRQQRPRPRRPDSSPAFPSVPAPS
jgi:uncharacterized protein